MPLHGGQVGGNNEARSGARTNGSETGMLSKHFLDRALSKIELTRSFGENHRGTIN